MPDLNDRDQGSGSLHEKLDRLEHLVTETCVHPAERAHLHAGVPAWKRKTDGEARWQVAVCTAVAIGLQVAVPERLAVMRPAWILPVLQGVRPDSRPRSKHPQVAGPARCLRRGKHAVGANGHA